ncbi:MAG: Smr/MutS family protein [Acidobacteria bacterium]|nr:Smr/MutS family protein [Acidobacteriota bacterium]
MRQISDDEWEEIFLADKKQKEREDRELFEQALANGVGKSAIKEPVPHAIAKSINLQRSFPKSVSPEIDATLDLHTKTKDESIMELRSFFQQTASAGDRTVLVITGKGHHSEKKGVLRDYVRKWLRGEGRQWLLWFAEAPKKFGGSGAWVVRLKP